MFENPFNSAGNWYKGNIHTHSNNSDGELSPEKLSGWYKSHGYDFLAISDHDKLTGVSGISDSTFLLINGMELSAASTETETSYHLLALGPTKEMQLPEGIDVQGAIDLIRSQGARVIVAHPYWSGLTINQLLPLNGIIGIEVFNTTCLTSIGKGISNVHWDDLLARGKHVLGFAVDDAHFHRPDHGQGWIMVKAPGLTKENILAGITKGCFYSTCGPEIRDIQLHQDSISVKCSEVAVINFISDSSRGKRVQAENGDLLTEAEFKCGGKERYVRVECVDVAGRLAWSNPFFLKK